MTSRRDDVLAVVVIPGLFVFAVRLGNVPVQALATARAFQNAGQDMCMIWIIDLFPPIGVCFPLRLEKTPIFLRNNRFVLPLINREISGKAWNGIILPKFFHITD